VNRFWATVCKTVRPMLSVRCLSCLSVCPVCDVGALWPNGWTDQDETWNAGRPRPWPHCASWGSSSPTPKGHSPQFLAHICCGQMAAWIKMSLGTELGLESTLCYMGRAPPPQFSDHAYCGQTGGWMKLVHGMEVGFSPADFVSDGDPAPPPKGGGAPSPIFGQFLLWQNG